eukprot:8385754-Karenia_brevis.AAC.1
MQIQIESQPKTGTAGNAAMEIDTGPTHNPQQPTTSPTPLMATQRQLHNARQQFEEAKAKYGLEEIVTKSLERTVRELEQKVSGVAISRGQVEHHQSLLELNRTREK